MPKKFKTTIRQTHTHILLGYSRCAAFGIHAYWHYHKFWNILCNSQKTESINVNSLFTYGAVSPSTWQIPTTYQCSFIAIDHPPYSPNLAPLNFHCSQNLKNTWEGFTLILIMHWKEKWYCGLHHQNKQFYNLQWWYQEIDLPLAEICWLPGWLWGEIIIQISRIKL